LLPTHHILFLQPPPPPASTLFPYTTLFRSGRSPHSLSPSPPLPLVPSSARSFAPSLPLAALSPPGRPSGADSPVLPSPGRPAAADRKSTRLNSSHVKISYAVFCLKKKKNK